MTQANLIIPPTQQSYRVLGAELYPNPMNGPVWSAYLYSMHVIDDALVDCASYAVRARYPQLAPFDAFPWIGQDRQIFQGPSETLTSYAARLIQWLDTWRLAGNSTSILLALLAYLTPLAPQVATVQSAADGSITSWRTYAAGSVPFPQGQTIPTPPYLQTVTGNWDWDGASQPYYYPWMAWRTWVIVSSFGAQAPWAAPTKTWGSGGTLVVSVVSDPVYGTVYKNTGTPATPSATSFNWGDGTCWGWAGTAQQAEQLTALVKAWKSGGTWVPWLIVNYDPTWFLETGVTGTKMPDGTWGFYGKIVTDATYGSRYIPSRPPASTCTLIVGTADGQAGQPLGVG